MMKLAIIMPAYNEERRISKTLSEYSDYFEMLSMKEKIEYELIVVINGTSDRTEEIVEEFVLQNSRIRYLNLISGGKGYAISEGFREALKRENDLIGFVDADMATSPEEFWKLASKIDDYDGVIADRYIKGAKVSPPNTFRRLIVSRMFNFLIRSLFFFNYRDTQCGAKVFKREIVENVLPNLNFSFWAFDVDLLYNIKKLGYRVKAVPTIWIDREYSKINFWKAGPWMALGVIKLRLQNSLFKELVKFYDIILRSIKLRKRQ